VMLAHTIGWPEPGSPLYHGGTALERACVQLADRLYSSSRLSAEWCATEYGVDAESIPVIHMGVDTELFRPRPLSEAQRPTLCFVGRIAESKGADQLVAAAIEIARSHRDLELVLVGEGEDGFVAGLRDTAERAGFPSLLRCPGFLDRRDLAAELARAHVFAAPSRYEGGPGLVYLEAMACGVPIVAPAGSGVEEVVADGETGLLVSPRDTTALTEAITRLLDDADLRGRLGTAARAFVVQEHDCAIGAERLERFLASVSVSAR
jgi:glycogen synthase